MKKFLLIVVSIVLFANCKEEKDDKVNQENDWQYEQTESEPAIQTNDEAEGKLGKAYDDDKSNEEPAPSNGNSSTSSYNPNKPAPDLVAFGMEEALLHNDLKEIKLGMTVKELENYNIKANQNLEKRAIDEKYDGVEFYEISKGGVVIMQLYIENEVVNLISLTSPNAFPKNMLGINHTFANIKAKYPNLEINANTVSTSNDGLDLIFILEERANGVI